MARILTQAIHFLKKETTMSTVKLHPVTQNRLPDTVKSNKDLSAARTFDADGLRRRAACLCFKDKKEKEILLISSTHDVSKWIVPGGGIDPGEEPDTAAEREAHEEAGALGVLDRFVGVFENVERKTRTWVYVFYVEQLLDHWTEAKSLDRRRQWFAIEDAKHMLSIHKPIQVQFITTCQANKT
ncbi:diphosphoinositol polyphosphate phosphohydrolase 1-like isoform X2 [Physella acuta]|uniref:diphosphoinositol polyphosphate phosphohydrolase 1-like isoform X2 n=1 Tax=Physella acuta TaxID=109671 RepID=UPI0027DB6517|nr:diphosphoinositol polyphosphate phosphohydrolase 1-like isoform X2 [Physella acuta]